MDDEIDFRVPDSDSRLKRTARPETRVMYPPENVYSDFARGARGARCDGQEDARSSSRDFGARYRAERRQQPARDEDRQLPVPRDDYLGRAFDDGVRARKWIKFSGNVPIGSYISHFETVSEYNDWTGYDKVAHFLKGFFDR